MTYVDKLIEEHLNQKVAAHEVYRSLFPPTEEMKKKGHPGGDRCMENMQKTCWQTLGNFIVYLRDRARIKASRSEKGWSVWVDQDMLDDDGCVDSDDDMPEPNMDKKPTAWNGVKKDKGTGTDTEAKFELKKAKELAGTEQVARSEASDRLNTAPMKGFSMAAKPALKKLKTCAGASGVDFTTEAAGPSGTTGGEESDAAVCKWCTVRMVVKVLDKRDKLWHKRKGQVLRIVAAGEVEIEASDHPGATLAVSEDKLETVIPAAGKNVMVCGGEHKGRVGKLIAIDEESFSVSVTLLDGMEVQGLPYEHACKVV